MIVLTHAAQGIQGVTQIQEFIDSAFIPTIKVRLASFDGENADPANGRPLGNNLRAYTPWGEIGVFCINPRKGGLRVLRLRGGKFRQVTVNTSL